MSKLKIYIIFFILFLVGIVIGGFNFYNSHYTIPSNSPTGTINLTIESGDSAYTIGKKLTNLKAIDNPEAFTWFHQFKPINNLQIGEFKVQTPANAEQILKQLTNANEQKIISNQEANKKPSINITFPEGITADQVINKLAKNNLGTTEELQNYIQDPKNFDLNKYQFLNKPLDCDYGNQSNCAKYYLEGYLYPDTYSFFQDSKPKEIFEKFLNNFQTKIWSKIPTNKQTNFYQSLIVASIVEKETGRPITGVNLNNQSELTSERENVASVLKNRVANNMKISSNPTVVYWNGGQTCEQTLEINNCVYLNDPQTDHLYNTYNNLGYPIGPISSPTLDGIQSVIKNKETDYLYFVAEKNGKTYFGVSDTDHQANIELVKIRNN
jgi:UPF0755 protein